VRSIQVATGDGSIVRPAESASDVRIADRSAGPASEISNRSTAIAARVPQQSSPRGSSRRDMPSTVVHVAFAGLLGVALLGDEFDTRAILFVMGCSALLDRYVDRRRRPRNTPRGVAQRLDRPRPRRPVAVGRHAPRNRSSGNGGGRTATASRGPRSPRYCSRTSCSTPSSTASISSGRSTTGFTTLGIVAHHRPARARPDVRRTQSRRRRRVDGARDDRKHPLQNGVRPDPRQAGDGRRADLPRRGDRRTVRPHRRRADRRSRSDRRGSAVGLK